MTFIDLPATSSHRGAQSGLYSPTVISHLRLTACQRLRCRYTPQNGL